MDAHVLNNMLPVMDKANKLMLKENLIKAFDLIGKAMHADRVPEEVIAFYDAHACVCMSHALSAVAFIVTVQVYVQAARQAHFWHSGVPWRKEEG